MVDTSNAIGTCDYCQEERIPLKRYKGGWWCHTCIKRDKMTNVSKSNYRKKLSNDRQYRKAINTSQ